ncbi:MAG: CYCXC family (seleno)protein [Candidatus Binataceae bacterium]
MAKQRPAAGLERMRWLLVLMICTAAAIAIAGGVFWYRSNAARSADNSSSNYAGGVVPASAGNPASQVLTLDPAAFAGEARDAYQIARNKPTLLVQLHCYCGCDVTLGHRNLLDCFRDRHASICATCMGEAVDANQMAKQNSPVEQIRDALRARYAGAE